MIQFPLGFNHFLPWCISIDRTLNQHSYVWANFLPIWMSDVYGQKGGQESLENEWCYWVIGLLVKCKVIIEKSRGEGSLMEQDTIENVS